MSGTLSDKHVKLLSTFFYNGYFPIAPGTTTSIVAALICLGLRDHPILYILFFIVTTAIGFMVCGRMEEIEKKKDPGCVTIDEVAGVCIAFWALPITPAVVVTTFFLWRAFDMFKIYPANKLEAQGGAMGIMADDLVAGLYTNIVMHIAIRWAGII